MRADIIKRLKRTVITTVLFALASLLYLLVISKYIAIPCVFNLLTGLKCPGCGMTRGLIAILHFDIAKALKLNAFAVPIIGYIAVIYFYAAVQYVKTGKYKVAFPVESINIAFLILLVLWWIFRNVFGI